MCRGSWGAQFSVLFRRSVLAQLRNPTDATSRLLLSCWVGILAGAALGLTVACWRHRVHPPQGA